MSVKVMCEACGKWHKLRNWGEVRKAVCLRCGTPLRRHLAMAEGPLISPEAETGYQQSYLVSSARAKAYHVARVLRRGGDKLRKRKKKSRD